MTVTRWRFVLPASSLATLLVVCAVVAATTEPEGSRAARVLSRDWLLGNSRLVAPLPMQEFAPPENGLAPHAAFEGRLVLAAGVDGGSIRVERDDYRTASRMPTALRSLPDLDVALVSVGNALVPVQRGPITSGHPYWEFVLEPGHLWSEPGDRGLTRAALPFSLMERNANCTHNGVLTFLFDRDGTVSRAAYQVASETCLYLKVDLWGTLGAQYRPGRVDGATRVREDYAREVSSRLPTRPIETLGRDHPGADSTAFGNEADVPAQDMTAFGFVIDGIHYVGGCMTRQGPYPFCDVLDLPSYSLAKSLVAGLGSLALAREYPGLLDEHIADYVPACKAVGRWSEVRFRDALDMATGNYASSLYDEDEDSAAMLEFFVAEDHAAKIQFACDHFPHKAAPGTRWVYHTTDTYVLGTALEAFVKKHLGPDRDFYQDIVVRRLWQPLGLSPVLHGIRRTRDDTAQAFTGWGLTLHRDDIARLGAFLAAPDGPHIDGRGVLDEAQARIALQRDRADRGLPALDDRFRYARGFWAHDVGAALGCASPVWVPYMVGFGGLTVLLMPNNTVYYYVSDGEAFRWLRAAVASHRIRPYCGSGTTS